MWCPQRVFFWPIAAEMLRPRAPALSGESQPYARTVGQALCVDRDFDWHGLWQLECLAHHSEPVLSVGSRDRKVFSRTKSCLAKRTLLGRRAMTFRALSIERTRDTDARKRSGQCWGMNASSSSVHQALLIKLCLSSSVVCFPNVLRSRRCASLPRHRSLCRIVPSSNPEPRDPPK